MNKKQILGNAHFPVRYFWLLVLFCGFLFSSALVACAQNVPGGVGIRLEEKKGVLQVIYIIPDSPAERAGFPTNSTIVSVDGTPTAGMALTNAVKLLRGDVGTTVKISVLLPDGTARDIPLTRVSMAALGHYLVVIKSRLIDNETGLLIAHAIDTNAPDDMETCLAGFQNQGVRHVILDLRNNNGGSLQAAIGVVSLFVGLGTPLWKDQKIGSDEATTTYGTREQVWKGDLVVLVNAKSFSAAEVIASACQTSGRAKIWGEATTGTVTLRRLETEADGTEKLVPDRELLTATGERLQGRGVKPDVLCDLPDEELYAKIAKSF